MLVRLCLLLALTLAAEYGPTCRVFWTRCSDECHASVKGQTIGTSACKTERDELGIYRKRCDVCRAGYWCDIETEQCKPLNSTLPNYPCTTNNDCMPWVTSYANRQLACSGGFCNYAQHTQMNGDNCTANIDCASFGLCSGGICRESGTCAFDYDCDAGRWCNAGTCQDVAQYSGVCVSDSHCRIDQVCVENVCVDVFSIDTGGDCAGTRKQKYGCAGGNMCVQQPSSLVFTCQVRDDLLGACSVSTDVSCSQQQACTCDLMKTRGTCRERNTQPRCASQYVRLFRCAIDNGCRTELGIFPPDTCVGQRCGREFTAVMSCESPYLYNTGADNCQQVKNVALQLGQPWSAAAQIDSIFN